MADAFFSRLGTIVLLYDAAAPDGDAASRDVLEQLAAVQAAVEARGGRAERLGAGLDLGDCKRRLAELRPGIVFNLVESLDGSDRLQAIVPLLLEDWRIAYTGCPAAAMVLANHKINAKCRLREKGLPTADAVWLDDRGGKATLPGGDGVSPGDWIVKTVESHASLFLDDASILRGATPAAAAEAVRQAERRHGQKFFAERFIDGREFNVSVLEKTGGEVEVLPLAEIDFSALPPDKPRLVGYDAKWQEDSSEYLTTPRTFRLADGDAGLAAELRRLALAAWAELGLSGYARVDFRVDKAGRPFILEVNTNPCLSPDAGFAAAAERGGMTYAALVEAIVRAGMRG